MQTHIHIHMHMHRDTHPQYTHTEGGREIQRKVEKLQGCPRFRIYVSGISPISSKDLNNLWELENTKMRFHFFGLFF